MSLGVRKPVVALIWISGPVAGVVIQPIFGIWSDHILTRFGRRRPFIILGTSAAVLSLLCFGWIEDIVNSFISLLFRDKISSDVSQIVLVMGAALCICCLNISIQAIQCGVRALMIDKCPSHQQDTASGLASMMIGIGNILSYSAGSIDLSNLFRSNETTQIKPSSIFVSITLTFTIALTCTFITEEIPDATEGNPRNQLIEGWGLLKSFKLIGAAARNLSPLAKQVHLVQFFTWIGWHIFLNYNTVYVIFSCNGCMNHELTKSRYTKKICMLQSYFI